MPKGLLAFQESITLASALRAPSRTDPPQRRFSGRGPKGPASWTELKQASQTSLALPQATQCPVR